MDKHLLQGTPEWVEYRKTKIGSSDSPIIMGVSPWKTPFQLWEEKLGLRGDSPVNDAMRRGKELEPVALYIYNNDCCYDKTLEPKVIESLENPWMIGSFDGFCEKTRTAVEIKCPKLSEHQLSLIHEEIPEKYYPQLQHLIAVANLESIDYLSYVDSINYVVINVKRDQKYIDKMIEKEKEFYDCLINLKAPELTDRDFIERDDGEWNKNAKSYIQYKEECELLLKMCDFYKNNLIELSNKQPSKGGGVTLSKVISKGRIDYSKVDELKGVDLEPYRSSSSESWRVNIN